MFMKLFSEVLQLSLYGAAAAVIIMLVKLLTGRRLPVHFHKALWIILILKLLLPFQIPSSLSLDHYISNVILENSLFESPGVIGESQIHDNPTSNIDDRITNDANLQSDGGQNKPTSIASDNYNVYVPDTGMPASPQKLPWGTNWMTVVAYIWLVGMTALLITFLTAYIRTKSILTSNSLHIDSESSEKISRLLQECQQELSYKHKIMLILTCRFPSPFVFGFLKPVVVLPEVLIDTMNEEQVKHILLHEITHIKGYDPLVRCLTTVLQAIHWFNPVLWAAFIWMAKDSERACDAAVIQDYDPQKRIQYASTLLSLAEQQSSKNMLLMPAFGENNIKTRIKDILKQRKHSLVSIIAAALIVAAAGVTILTHEVGNTQLPSFEVYVLERENTADGRSGDYEESRKLLFTQEDILAYDWEHQVIRVRNNESFNSDLLQKDAEVVVNGEVIYTTTFWSPLFSMMPPDIPIYNQNLVYNETEDEIILLIGRWHLDPDVVPPSVMSKVMDERIHRALIELNTPLAIEQEMIDALSVWNPEAAEEVSESKDLPEGQETSTPAGETEDELYARVKFLLSQILNPLSASSNPYDYINGNKDFEELVSLGEPAMHIMFDMFAEHHGDGLQEYVMAAACAKILDVYDEERGIGIHSGAEWFMKYGQFGSDSLHFIDADYNDFQGIGSIEEGIMLPERTDRANLEEVISDYILARNRHAFYMGEKAFEAHHIFRTEETGGITNVYLLVRFAWFEFQDGVFTSVSGTGGIPVRMDLKKSQNGQYEVISYKEPMDGGMWRTSLQEMFPDDLVQLVTEREKMLQWEKEQVNNITEQAAEYLKSIGRENASVEYRYMPERLGEEQSRAIYQITAMQKGFPDWIGSREALVNTGGPYPGKQVRCHMETSISQSGGGEYIVTLTRSWNTIINGDKPVSIWKYKAAGDSVSLIEERNMDQLITFVK